MSVCWQFCSEQVVWGRDRTPRLAGCLDASLAVVLCQILLLWTLWKPAQTPSLVQSFHASGFAVKSIPLFQKMVLSPNETHLGQDVIYAPHSRPGWLWPINAKARWQHLAITSKVVRISAMGNSDTLGLVLTIWIFGDG